MSKSDNGKTNKIFTIGYAGKNACQFFTILTQAGIRKVMDVRLYNTSQLAGFTKKQDIEYFLQTIVGAEYIHMPIMAPTKQLLGDYKCRLSLALNIFICQLWHRLNNCSAIIKRG